MNVYDFDKTIVPFDSGSLFWGYSMLHYPWIILFLPFQAFLALLMIIKVIDFTIFKKYFFCFVMFIPLKKAVKGFWDRHENQVHKWFFNRKRYSVVISASPDFLLGEIQKRLGFDELICTRHNAKTGAIIGKNCRDEEKVNRLFELYNKDDIEVIDVYSDSIKHDKPIFSLGKNCYHIVKGKKVPFEFKNIYG